MKRGWRDKKRVTTLLYFNKYWVLAYTKIPPKSLKLYRAPSEMNSKAQKTYGMLLKLSGKLLIHLSNIS